MDNDRLDKRRAYEAAKTYERAYHERFYPLPVLGARRAEVVTAEVVQELERLKAVSEAAKLEWDASRPARPTPVGDSR